MDNLKLLNNVRKIDGIELNMNKHTEDIKELSSQLDTNVRELTSKINEVASTGTTTEIIQNKVSEMAQNGTITFNTVSPEMTTFFNISKSKNMFNGVIHNGYVLNYPFHSS